MLRIVMPARLGSTRLPGKMLERIGSRAVIQHSVARVLEATTGGFNFTVATDAEAIFAAVHSQVAVIMTSPDCRSGTDRCAEVAELQRWPDEDIVVNVQADMPFISPRYLAGFLGSAECGGAWDVLTAVVNQRLVRADHDGFNRVVMPLHVGLYAYKRPALRQFAALETASQERLQGLEQLRAVEAGMLIDFHVLPDMPLEINTIEDLEAARQIARCLA